MNMQIQVAVLKNSSDYFRDTSNSLTCLSPHHTFVHILTSILPAFCFLIF